MKEHENKKYVMHNIILIVIAIVLILSAALYAYAKYATNVVGQGTLTVAKVICEMETEASEANETIINPYCTVKIKNYNSEDEITNTALEYTVKIVTEDGIAIPDYYWKDSEGNVIATNSPLTGNFGLEEKEEDVATVYFKNSVQDDLIQKIKFQLVAKQI